MKTLTAIARALTSPASKMVTIFLSGACACTWTLLMLIIALPQVAP